MIAQNCSFLEKIHIFRGHKDQVKWVIRVSILKALSQHEIIMIALGPESSGIVS